MDYDSTGALSTIQNASLSTRFDTVMSTEELIPVQVTFSIGSAESLCSAGMNILLDTWYQAVGICVMVLEIR